MNMFSFTQLVVELRAQIANNQDVIFRSSHHIWGWLEMSMEKRKMAHKIFMEDSCFFFSLFLARS